jgi:NTP pyrophosphatase (non-canonical NTP hydrolase)
MDTLREQCPWDQKQTMESLRHLTIEETYELSDAILDGDVQEIRKELGDLMLHLVFYARIASETQQFTITEVLNGICDKLISRHPHIYGDITVKDEAEVKRNWEQLKLKEGNKSVLGGVPSSLPSLIKASRIQEKNYDVYAVLSDGECNEGSVWECALMAAAQKVNNLTIFVDYNKWQATGRSNEVLGLAPLAAKWSAFGWATAEIDGHSFEEMAQALQKLSSDPRPKAVICNTIKGKGIPFMEDDNNWHYRIPTEREVVQSAEILGIPEKDIHLGGRAPIRHG